MMAENGESFLSQRQLMVELQLRKRGIRDERVLDAMFRVPRHEFVPAAARRQAYDDQPLEIGSGQTISQPYIIAAMMQALALTGNEQALEVGTGSGYATAVLSLLVRHVVTLERYELLLESARERLQRFGFLNVSCITADGSLGWPANAPYDAILVSAAAPATPPALLEQLAPGGRLIVPVGSLESQELMLYRRTFDGIQEERLEGCRFVPLIGSSGFPQ